MAQTQGPTLEPIATKGLAGVPSGWKDAIVRFFNNITGLLEYARTANVFSTVSATALGDTAVWTPSANTLKFRIMGGIITIPSNVSIAAGAVVVITLRDATTDLKLTFSVFIPTTAVTTGNGATVIPFTLPGNGILSAVANNALNVNLSVALATGAVRVSVWGTEE